MVRHLDDRNRDPCLGAKRLAFDRYGAIQVHNSHVERRVLDSQLGYSGHPHRFELLTVVPQKRVPFLRNSYENDVLNFLDQFTGVLFYDFRHVYGALHFYRVPLQGPILAFQGTDHQELFRSVD